LKLSGKMTDYTLSMRTAVKGQDIPQATITLDAKGNERQINLDMWLSEIFESLGRSPMAGQEVRLIELPVIGQHGVLNDLHSFSTP
ncbi:hypothetical protein MJI47_27325, partial [Salmonella enterica subsp. enterica serovar Kentucky]|nr:hypothetical protein [Salmonella enterica subsp. enterica serovar Kentucky]